MYVCFVPHFASKCIKNFFPHQSLSLSSLWGSKFWENDQNCLLRSYSCQWHHFKPNPSTQFSSTVFHIFLKMEKNVFNAFCHTPPQVYRKIFKKKLRNQKCKENLIETCIFWKPLLLSTSRTLNFPHDELWKKANFKI